MLEEMGLVGLLMKMLGRVVELMFIVMVFWKGGGGQEGEGKVVRFRVFKIMKMFVICD